MNRFRWLLLVAIVAGLAPRAEAQPYAPLKAPTKSMPITAPAPVLWENKYFGDKIDAEMAKAAALGVAPVEIVGPESAAEIGAGGRVFKWVVTAEGKLLGLPKLNKGDAWRGKVADADDVIKHSTAAAGKPVLTAGNGRLKGAETVLIDRRSGHYRPDAASMKIAREKFENAGFQVEIVEGVE